MFSPVFWVPFRGPKWNSDRYGYESIINNLLMYHISIISYYIHTWPHIIFLNALTLTIEICAYVSSVYCKEIMCHKLTKIKGWKILSNHVYWTVCLYELSFLTVRIFWAMGGITLAHIDKEYPFSLAALSKRNHLLHRC